MDKFISHTGTAVPLRRSNVDTDQIIPAAYLKRVTRTGFEDGLFAAWRTDPDFVLNRPQRKGATVLVAGPDFGTGSSREHAVWALQNYGFKAVLAARFADIFRGNSLKAGLLTVVLPQETVEQIWVAVEADPATEVTVDLDAREVRCGHLSAAFEMDNYTRWRLMEGLDDIGLTLRNVDAIDTFEQNRPSFTPRSDAEDSPVPFAVSFNGQTAPADMLEVVLQNPERRVAKPQRPTKNGTSAAKAKSEDRRARLIAAALKLFSVRAYDLVFIDDIADEADVAHGLVSYYFGSKRNLYVAALEQVFADLEKFITPQPADGDTAAQIRSIIRRHFEYFHTHPHVLLGLLRASPGDTAEATIRESVHRSAVTTYMQMLDLAPSEAPPFLRSALSGCLGFTDQVIIDWLIHDQDVPLDLVVDLCANMTIATIAAAVPDFASSLT